MLWTFNIHLNSHINSIFLCRVNNTVTQLYKERKKDSLKNQVHHETNGLVRSMVFNATFNNISVISWWSVLLVEETGVPGQNHRSAASHWQTLSHSFVSRHKWICIHSIYWGSKFYWWFKFLHNINVSFYT